MFFLSSSASSQTLKSKQHVCTLLSIFSPFSFPLFCNWTITYCKWPWETTADKWAIFHCQVDHQSTHYYIHLITSHSPRCSFCGPDFATHDFWLILSSVHNWWYPYVLCERNQGFESFMDNFTSQSYHGLFDSTDLDLQSAWQRANHVFIEMNSYT